MSPAKRITQALTLDLSTLSFGKLVALVGGLLTFAAGVGGAARIVGNVETKTHAEKTFVRKDSMAIQQAGEARRYSVDSVSHSAELARIDTALGALVRDCRRRGGCSP